MPSGPRVRSADAAALVAAHEASRRPVLYVGVSSVDETLKKVKAAGGKVVTPKTPIPGMGAYARVADTEGNVVGLFEGM